MLEAFSLSQNPPSIPTLAVVLTFAERQKSRHKTRTQCGLELGWFIERGQVLADGDYLLCASGEIVHIIAAAEAVSQVESRDHFLLTRAAYHLGNRHVPLQIGPNFLRYQHDHVLDAMVEGLGLSVHLAQLPFHPENGAYHGRSVVQLGSHPHSHSHD